MHLRRVKRLVYVTRKARKRRDTFIAAKTKPTARAEDDSTALCYSVIKGTINRPSHANAIMCHVEHGGRQLTLFPRHTRISATGTALIGGRAATGGYLLFTVKEINSGSFRACLRYSRGRSKSAKEIRVSGARHRVARHGGDVAREERAHGDHVSDAARPRRAVLPKIEQATRGRSSKRGHNKYRRQISGPRLRKTAGQDPRRVRSVKRAITNYR